MVILLIFDYFMKRSLATLYTIITNKAKEGTELLLISDANQRAG